MVAYSFQKQFANDVESGKKLQTIRESNRAKAGDRLQLYTGMRTKSCRKLRDAVCVAADTVRITPEGPIFGQPGWWPKDKDVFAVRDGFLSYDNMYDFFCCDTGKEIFYGYVIMWNALPESKDGKTK